ncbi:MAG: pilus assembly protein [Planctomycetaceae bacterium]|nr:pilus assembly protein [Planctomycetaceae bacterium]
MITSRKSLKKQKPTRRRGALVVEMAFVLPILVTVIFACLEFSRMNMIRNTAKNAAYKAARKAIVPGATAAGAQTEATNLMHSIGVNDSTVTIIPPVITSGTMTVTVNIQTNLSGNLFFAPMFLKNKSITTTCTLNREDY